VPQAFCFLKKRTRPSAPTKNEQGGEDDERLRIWRGRLERERVEQGGRINNCATIWEAFEQAPEHPRQVEIEIARRDRVRREVRAELIRELETEISS
jgi:hypothetical protein